MKITIIKPDELFETMQQLNLLKVKFGSSDTWIAAPVLFAAQESVDLIINTENAVGLQAGEVVILKFQKYGYEYIVSGECAYIRSEDPTLVSVRITMAQRHFNLRKHMRFDTNLKVIIKNAGGHHVESMAKNISRGGAMIVTKADIGMNSPINIQITFQSQNSFNAVAKILRKSSDNENGFSYGIQFEDISEDNSRVFNKEILKYEREYIKTLDILKECINKNDSCFSARISIFSFAADESYEIREILIKMGAENFDVFHNFKFYYDFFVEENPKIVVIDTDMIKTEVLDLLNKINDRFPDIRVVLLTALNDAAGNEEIEGIPDGITVLYKPLIFDEFEKEIIKYM
jgi:hypothetical protein